MKRPAAPIYTLWFLAALAWAGWPPLALSVVDSIIPLRSDYWSDPQFIKKFTASYGFDSNIEPSINSEEKEIFNQLIPLIRSNINAAITTLHANLTSQSSAALDFTLGNLYFESGIYNEAVRQYLRAIQKFPNFRRAYNLLGKVYVRTGNLNAAIPYFIKTIELGGGDGDIYGLLGYCYLNQKKFDSAETAYNQALLYTPESIDWKLGKAQCLLALQKWKEAIGLFEELLKKTPDKPEIWLLQANAYLGIGETHWAAANYEMLRRMKNASPESLFQLGDIYINENLLHLAYPVYLEALQADSKQDLKRPLRVAKILTGRSAWDDASRYIASIRHTYSEGLSHESELQLLTLESKIALATGDREKALQTLNSILSRDPMNGEALLILAKFQWKNDQVEKAIVNYEAARKIGKFRVEALLDQAQMHVALKEYNKAVLLLQEAQEIDPRDNVRKYLEAVERAAFSSKR